MKRWLSNMAAGVSLLLCLGSAVLWARSYWTQYALYSHGVNSHLNLSVCLVNRGTAYLGLLDRTAPDYWVQVQRRPTTQSVHPDEHSWAGFGYVVEPFSLYVAVLPLWIISFVLGLLAWQFRRAASASGNDIGFCHVCGYDLRATPERCPECGTIPAAAPPHP